MNRKLLFGGVLLALVLAFVLAMQAFTGQQGDAARERVAGNRSALERAHAPRVGPADAPVVIVEFLDPACGTCAAFYPMVKSLMGRYPGQVQLVLRYAPFHPGSEPVVAMLEAARRQDRLWPALETLLANQGAWTRNHQALPEQALAVLEHAGVDTNRLSFDMTDTAIRELIAQDVADARALGVTKTPEFFVNGEPLPRFGFDQLEALVADAVARSR
ncbi:MAG: DsbA family protein [Rhodocyclaceae bacterium]|nr:DsbA family protein [Rhodocyclaceae bacterium]